jgi:hypothetical protein
LAQRHWLDRLSVGRSQRLLFQHLRTRLSEFECRKRAQFFRGRVKSEHALLLPGAKLQWLRCKRQFRHYKCVDDAVDLFCPPHPADVATALWAVFPRVTGGEEANRPPAFARYDEASRPVTTTSINSLSGVPGLH